MALTDEAARHLSYSLLTAETARDGQRTIGASNLSNGCSFCLASNLMGDMRDTPMMDRVWLGRTLGTSIHGIFEQRANGLKWFAERHPGALVERHITLGEIPNYGKVGSTPDLTLVDELHTFDWKSSTRKKSAIMTDAIGRTHFGRTHKDIKLSETKYAEAIRDALYKVGGYHSQVQSYMRGLNNMGTPVERGTLVFVNRDGTGYFDHPASGGYEDDERVHDLWVLSFDYNAQAAEAVWDRGLQIWAALENGAVPSDFARHESCFPCSQERQQDRIAA